MAPGPAIKVLGITRVIKAFRGIDRSLATQFGDDLKQAADPVRADATTKISRYRGASLGTIRTRKTAGARIYVEQSAKKVTGQHAQFGSLQMKKGLLPALDENEEEVRASIERVLERYAAMEGF